jgi:acetyl esterase/lipase
VNAALNAFGPRDARSGGLIPFRPYLEGVDETSPLVTPALYQNVLAKFPPTLLVTGTRDVAMSNAIVTNLKLQEAGVETQLLVLEGFGHGQFNEFVETPETTAAYRVIWKFFDRYLSR